MIEHVSGVLIAGGRVGEWGKTNAFLRWRVLVHLNTFFVCDGKCFPKM